MLILCRRSIYAANSAVWTVNPSAAACSSFYPWPSQLLFFCCRKHDVHIHAAQPPWKDPDKSQSLGRCDGNWAPVLSEHFYLGVMLRNGKHPCSSTIRYTLTVTATQATVTLKITTQTFLASSRSSGRLKILRQVNALLCNSPPSH